MCWPVCPAAPVTRTRRGVSVASAEAELHAVSRKIIEEVVIFIVQMSDSISRYQCWNGEQR